MAMIRTKLVTVSSTGSFTEIGGIQGPILTIVVMDYNTIYKLLINGRIVWEHNPENRKQKKRLTLKNYRKKNNFDPSADDEPTGDLVMGVEGMPDDDYIDENDKIYVDIIKTLKKDGVVQRKKPVLNDDEPVTVGL